MDFELSEDQEALRGAARDLLLRRSTREVVRAVVDGGGGWDRGLWAEMTDQGWPGIAVAEVDGGVGLGWVEGAVLLEAVGAHLAPTPVLGQMVALDALAGVDGAMAGELVAGLLDGSLVAAVTADPVTPVPYAPSADVVVACRGIGSDVEVVLIDQRGSRPPAEPAMDLTRELGWLDPTAVEVATVVGGADAARRLVDVGAVAYSAELLGLAQAALDMTVAYAKDRVQFGKPIGSFQAVKHRCADMLVDVEGMRSSLYWAAWCVAVRDDDASVAASTAKSWCSDAADRVMSSALQVHGGIGFTWESDVHLLLKRAHLDRIEMGSATWHRRRLAAELRRRVRAGERLI